MENKNDGMMKKKMMMVPQEMMVAHRRNPLPRKVVVLLV